MYHPLSRAAQAMLVLMLKREDKGGLRQFEVGEGGDRTWAQPLSQVPLYLCTLCTLCTLVLGRLQLIPVGHFGIWCPAGHRAIQTLCR